jgi:hypothetical protein
MDMSVPPPPTIAWVLHEDEDPQRLRRLLARQTAETGGAATWTAVNYFYDAEGNEQESLFEVLDPSLRRAWRERPGAESGRELFDSVRRVMIGGELVAVTGFDWGLEGQDSVASQQVVVALGDRVARLLLETIDGALDFVIFDRDLRAFQVEPDGEVIPRRD